MMQVPICIQDFEEHAEKSLPRHVYQYFSAGADDGFSARENREAYKRLRIRPSVLKGIKSVDTTTTVLDIPVTYPICISPTATHVWAHQDKEIGTVKAAAEHGVGVAVSLHASSKFDDITSAANGSFTMLQLQFFRDKNMTLALVDKAERKGFKALVLTVDSPTLGFKRNELRNNHPEKIFLTISENLLMDLLPRSPDAGVMEAWDQYMDEMFYPNISWEDVDWLRSKTKLPIVLKGILTGEDAAEAIEHGINGIIVSNHGGRQLDGVPATIETLPEVVKAVDGKCEVFVDGGIRCGTDVLKALALGARAVFVGRPIIWGLAYKGQEGVKKVLDILSEELKRAMMLAGCDSVKNIKRSMVVHENYYARLLSDINTADYVYK